MIAISYRRDDTLPIAGRLYDRLQAKFGKPNVFMDFDSIRPGLDFRAQIKETIDRADVVIALIGPHWTGTEADKSRRIDDVNDFVRLEIAHALKRNIPIIPVLINNTPMPKSDGLPEDIQSLVYRHALPLDSGLDFHQHADRVISGVCDLIRSTSLPDAEAEQPGFKRLPDSSRSRRRSVVWMLIVAFLLAIGIAAWFTIARQANDRGVTRQAAAPRLAGAGATPEFSSTGPSAGRPVVEISSQPAGANVSRDGVVVGKTPLRRDDLGSGAAKFVLVADGYLPRTLEGQIDPVNGLKNHISLVRAAPLYAGTVRLRDGDSNGQTRPIAIAPNPDLVSGTMTQGSKRGDLIVRFSGVWEGTELHAVTRDVVSLPPGVEWTPESFVLRFSGDGLHADYECVADGKTYVAALSARMEFQARLAPAYKGTVLPGSLPIKIVIGADRKSGTLIETTKSGDTQVAFTGVWDGQALHAVTGDVLVKPAKVQWKAETFSLRFSDDGRRVSYSCNDGGQMLTAELSPVP